MTHTQVSLGVCPSLGESVGDANARAQFLLSTTANSKWNCARSQHLQSVRVKKWSKFARHHKSWGLALRWLKEFAAFARAMCSANGVTYCPVKMRADNELCCMFLTEVAEQMKGVSRVVAARRALSCQRLREGSSSLNGDHDITILIDGVRRSQPKTVHQMESLDVNDVATIAAALSHSSKWQLRQLGVMIAAAAKNSARWCASGLQERRRSNTFESIDFA